MYMYVRVYVYVHVYMYVCVCMWLKRTTQYIRMCTHTYTVHSYVYTHIYVPMHVHVQVALDRSGTVLVVASEDHSVKVFDANDGSFLSTLDGHEEAVQAVAFDATGGMLVTSGSDNTFRIWS